MTANITYRLGTAGTPPVSTTFKNLPLNNTEIDGNFKSILNDIDLKAPIDSPTFTTTATAPTPAAYDSSTKIATTAYVQGATIPLSVASVGGKFDITATTPTATNRLNYSGAFWPTTINLSGTAVSALAASHYYFENASDGVVRPKTLADVKTEIVTNAAVNSAAATTVGTVTSGTWNASTVGVLYGGTGATTQQGAINALAGATTAAKFLRGDGANVTMSSITGSDVPVLNQDTTGTATNAINLNGAGTAKTAATAGSGYGLWNSGAITYGTLMALSTDTTYGGRNGTEATSDYNMYFTMNGGTNRGFVFRSAYGTNLFSINPDGVRTSLAVTGSSFNSITGLGTTTAPNGVAAGGSATTVSKSDHVHAMPTASDVGLGNVTNESKATMFTNAAFTGTTTGITSTMVGLGNVTNESKTTMFSSPAFTANATAVNLTITGDLTVGGTTTAINATNLNVADLNITVGSGAINQASINGAGLTFGNYASNPTLLYGSAGNDFTFNRNIVASNFSGSSSGTNTGDQTGGTPALVLGTANTAGTSTNFIRRDDTILVFDTTVPAAAGTAAAGSASTAARRDHVHPVQTTVSGQAGSVSNAVTFNNTGTGAVSGTTFNGGAAQTISYNTIGAQVAGTYVNTVNGVSGTVTLTNLGLQNFTAGSTVSGSNTGDQTWSTLSGKPTTLSTIATNDLGNYGGWITSSGTSAACSGAAASANALNTANSYQGVNFTSTGQYFVASGTAATPSIAFSADGGQDTGFYWISDGVIGFASNSVYAGQIASGGNLTMVGNITAYSDIRIKTNITKITGALDKVDQLNGYTFDRTDINTPRQTGVIAQEVLKVLPEAVLGTEEGTYGVAYGNMVGLLIEAIKELRAEVAELRGMK